MDLMSSFFLLTLTSLAISLLLNLYQYRRIYQYSALIKATMKQLSILRKTPENSGLLFVDPPTQSNTLKLNEEFTRLGSLVTGLQARKAEAEQILDQLAEAVIVLDLNKTILMMNQVAKSWLLDSPGSYLPETLELLGSTELLKAYDICIDKSEPVRQEVKIYRKGNERTCHISSQHILKPTRVIIIIHDISRMVRLESMRQEFVANVSHELKTPVTSILGFSETILDEPDELSPQNLKFLDIIHKQANRLRNIIEDLLTLSRLEQEGAEIRFENADPNIVLSNAVEACKYKAEKKQTQLLVQSNFQGTLSMNQPLIEQAMINLLENAIKYGNPSGKVLLKLYDDSKFLVLEVIDEGPGIPQRELQAIFQRFYRIDKARSRNLGGTGLGLSIVKHIARVHHGSVVAQSTLGKGSVFTLKITKEPGATTGVPQ